MIVSYAIAWIAIYGLYLSQRPATTVRVEATLEPTGDHRSTTKALVQGSVRVNLALADARTLDIIESSRTTVVLLISPSDCSKLAAGGSCRSNVLTALPPISVSWKKRAGPIAVTRGGVSDARVTLLDSNVIAVASSGATPTTACVSPPTNRDVLNVQLQTTTRPAEVDVLHTAVTCSTGLRVVITHGNSPAGREAFALEGLMTLDLRLEGKKLTLTGPKAGTVHVPGGHDLDRTALVVQGEEAIRAHITLEDQHVSLEIPPTRAISVRQAGAELVPTNLDRNQKWVTAAFFGGAGLIAALINVGGALHKQIGGKPDES